MNKRSPVTAVKVLVATLCASLILVPSGARSMGAGQSQDVWAEYVDAKQWFKIEYPAAYKVDPPTVKPGPNGEKPIGGVLTFSNVKRDSAHGKHGQSGVQIVVGLHIAERDPAKPLEGWAVKLLLDGSTYTAAQLHYAAKASVLDKVNSQNPTARVAEQLVTAVVLEGSSPAVPEWKTTLIPYGNVVLFIWTNSRKAEDAAVYDHMVTSLRFTDKTPRTLQEAYGAAVTTKASSRKSQQPRQGTVPTAGC